MKGFPSQGHWVALECQEPQDRAGEALVLRWNWESDPFLSLAFCGEGEVRVAKWRRGSAWLPALGKDVMISELHVHGSWWWTTHWA